MSAAPFADRAIAALRAKGSPLCVGLDPFPDRIPALFGNARADPGAVERFIGEIVALAGEAASAVKLQLGLFEPYGAQGVAAAERLCAQARDQGLIVILDAKRGDIASTAEGYARAALGPPPGFDADAVTVSPYLGLDSLQPFIVAAQAYAKGVALLVRTSNPGARDLQDLPVEGRPLWERVGEMAATLEPALMGASGWSGLMAVAGATYPEEARRLRAILPHALFLVPGYGAQGASADAAVAGFARGPRGLEGGFVNSGRSVLYPPGAERAGALAPWRALVRAALTDAAEDLRRACAG